METLHRLLDRGASLPAEYGAGLTSHLPMALHALQRLGAGGARIESFHDHYVQRFGDRREPVPLLRRVADWQTLRGDWAAFAALRGHFAAALAEEGAEAVVAAALPALWPGVAAAAFHGPIRVAHAVEIGHADELAAALAYWAARWQPVVGTPSTEPALDIDTWFEHFIAAGTAAALKAPLISGCIEKACATAVFRADAARLVPPADAVGALAVRAARLYAQSRNFTVLHLVTGARAARVLGAFVAPSPTALWPAVAAALMAADVGDRALPPCGDAPWAEVIAAAIASDDDHVIKLVQACTDHARHDPDPVFLEAARRAVS